MSSLIADGSSALFRFGIRADGLTVLVAAKDNRRGGGRAQG